MDDRIRVAQVMGRMNKGGVEATIMNLFRYTDHSRFRFDFIVQEDSNYIPREEIEALGGSVHVIAPYKHPVHYVRELSQVLDRIRPDIVHANVNALSVIPLAVAQHENVGVRVVHSHSTAHSSEIAKTAVKNMLRPFSKWKATDLAACGELSARWLYGDRAVDGGRVHFIRNAIELDSYAMQPDVQAKKRELGLDDGLIVGQVGRLCVQKNQIFTLKVFAALLYERPDATLLLVGAGSGRYTRKLEQEAHRLGISDHVHFLGARNDVAELYHVFDVMAFPSKYEGLPLSLIEAQAAGCLTVVSDEVTREVNIVSGLIANLPLSASPRRWARQLLEMAGKGPTNDEQHGNNVRLLAEAGYDIRESAKQVNAWYEKLLDEHHQGKASQ
ncbi:glycosyl transferase [Bifidobacterium anseris]|uniref:Glycosyl transferase n=1 Tax=Bifidobacterium anseris TaxID=2020963 RepID=A0A2N5IZS6_9BIFI|nr:glycosyltransferase [Bifidobacterium anseris]PLS27459.1 glycosyl transferase [Bifidobacterium anseris]